jgi:hypothetical protein
VRERFALDVLLADVPADQVDDARRFYKLWAAGRGPSTPEELGKYGRGGPLMTGDRLGVLWAVGHTTA